MPRILPLPASSSYRPFHFAGQLFQAEGIDARTREIIMLRAAKVLNSTYEWQANVVLGKNAGLIVEEIEASASDGPVVGIDADYVLACRATDELSKTAYMGRICLRSRLRALILQV